MKIFEYMRLLRKSWILIVSLTLLGVIVAGAYSLRVSQEFSATNTFSIDSSSDYKSVDDWLTARDLTQRFASEVVSDFLTSVPNQSGMISVSLSESNPTEILITAVSPSEGEALDLLQAESMRFVNYVSSISQNSKELQIKIKEKNILSSDQNKTSGFSILLVGAVLGFTTGLSISLIKAGRNRVFYEASELELALGVPILGTFNLLNSYDPATNAGFNELRTRSILLNKDTDFHLVLLTGIDSDIDISPIANGLSNAFARTNRKTLVISAEFGSSVKESNLTNSKELGFGELLSSRLSVEELIGGKEIPNPFFLPQGAIPNNPYDLLGSVNTHKVMEEFKQYFDVVIISCSPLTENIEALMLTRETGITILVAERGKTSENNMKSVLGKLSTTPSNSIAILLLDSKISVMSNISSGVGIRNE